MLSSKAYVRSRLHYPSPSPALSAMELDRILAAGESGNTAQLHDMLPESITPDVTGDYILPVPMVPIQADLYDRVISSTYSEILKFFCAPSDNQFKSLVDKLKSMLEQLDLCGTHPGLLIVQYVPHSLINKEAPRKLEEFSGKFKVLGMLARALELYGKHVGVIADAGRTTDLVEAYLLDKPVNVQRYSGKRVRENTHIEKNRTFFHLVPADLRDLTASVNAPFDMMIVIDNAFDVSSPYANGLRAQLRDPTRRKPLAPLVRLVPLKSAQHAMLDPSFGFKDRIASAVVNRMQAGEIPPKQQKVFECDLLPLRPWFNDMDGPWPLGRPDALVVYGTRDVDRSLHAPELTEPDSKRAKTISNTNVKEEENGVSSDVKPSISHDQNIESKVDELTSKLASLSEINRRQSEELSSHRELASRRQLEVDTLRAEMANQVRSKNDFEQKCKKLEDRVDRLRSEKDRFNDRLRHFEERYDTLIAQLQEKGESSSTELKLAEATRKMQELEEKLESAERHNTAHTAKEQVAIEQYRNASTAAQEMKMERDAMAAQLEELKEKADGNAVKVIELANNSKAAALTDQIKRLEAEIENYKTSTKIVMDQQQSIPATARDRAHHRRGY